MNIYTKFQNFIHKKKSQKKNYKKNMSLKKFNQLHDKNPNEKSNNNGGNSCSISWCVLFTLILSLSFIYFDSLIYKIPKNPNIITNVNLSHHTNVSIDSLVYNKVDKNVTYVNVTTSPPSTSTLLVSTFSTPNNVTVDKCEGKYIFIQELPRQFNDEMVEKCRELNKWTDMCKYVTNSGFGPRIKNGSGWFDTNQFSLELIFRTRMKKYRCLTTNSSKASAVYVPFYPGLDVGRYLWDRNVTTLKDSASLSLVKYLREKPEWTVLHGRDHFLVSGRITWDFRRSKTDQTGWGNRLFTLPEVQNMTSLIIESSPWSNTDFAVPYPTYFHPSTDLELGRWQARVSKQRRPYLFSFAGAPRPDLKDSIRNEIIDQCLGSKTKNNCKLINCDKNPNHCQNPNDLMSVFQHSVFCLQPPGDSYTRRSTFDSIISGCIPVFFHPGSAYIQYKWHLPKDYSTYSVFIPIEDVKRANSTNNLSIEKVLLGFSKEKIRAMRENVIKLIPRIIYTNVGNDSGLTGVEDAFEVSVKEVLKRVERIRAGKTRESYPEEYSWKYNFFGNLENYEWDKYFSRT